MQENFVRNATAQLAVSLVVLLVGTAIGIYFERTQSSENNQTRYLDVRTESNAGILSRPSMPGRNLEILLDSKPIDNISSTSVRIYNYSDRDFENVPVLLELRSGSENSVLEILHQKVLGPGGIEETVQRIPSSNKRSEPNHLRFLLATVNRSLDSSEPVFEALFIAQGNEPPKIKLHIDKKGLKHRTYSNRWRERGFVDMIVFTWNNSRSSFLILLGLLVALFVTFRVQRKAEKVFERRRQVWLSDALIRELESSARREEFDLPADTDGRELSKFFVEFSSEFTNEHPDTLRNIIRAWQEERST